jgi:hypothetical protein
MDIWGADYGVPDDCDLFNQDICSKVLVGHQPTSEYLMTMLQSSGFIGTGRWLTGNDIEFPGVRSTFRLTIDPINSPALNLLPYIPFKLGFGYRLGIPEIDNIQKLTDIPHAVADVSAVAGFKPLI